MDQLTRSPRAQRLTGTALAGVRMIVVTGLLLAACSGGAASPGSAASSGGARASSGASSGTAGSTVTIENLAFSPAALNVTAGTTVTFSNRDTIGHTAVNGVKGVADPKALFNLDLPAGTAGTFKFDKPGTYQVTCTIHPAMHMTITVK
jgi:plastocyanin